jgi:hypothetical protein
MQRTMGISRKAKKAVEPMTAPTVDPAEPEEST